MTTPVLHDDVLRTILSLMDSKELGRTTLVCHKWRRWAWRIILKERLCNKSRETLSIGVCIPGSLLMIGNRPGGITIRKREDGLYNMDFRNAGEKWGEFLFHMQVFGDLLGFVK